MLDLGANVIFGQYVDTGSPVHRLDPRFKLTAAGALIVSTFVLGSPAAMLALLPILVVIHAVARLPAGLVLKGSRFMIAFLLVFLAISLLLYPVAGSTHVLWRWHVLNVSREGIRAAALVGARIALLYDVTTVLLLCTSLVDITDGAEALLSPLRRLHVPVHEFVLVGVIALKFVPIFTREAERLIRARTVRGVPFDSGHFLLRGRRIGQLLVPIVIGGFRRADVLTEALDARCYRGGRGRTRLRRMQAMTADWLTLGITLAWIAAAWIVGQAAGW